MKKTLFLFTFSFTVISIEIHSDEKIPLQHFFL